MELKKKPNVNLERFKNVFLQVGLIISLGTIFVAFEWPSREISVEILTMNEANFEEEEIPVTRETPPEQAPPPPAPQVTEVLNIVEDEVEIEVELEIEDADVDADAEIEFQDIQEEEEVEEEVFFIVETMPSFVGGAPAMNKFIGQSVKYPQIAKENDIQGKVFVRFCVTKSGKVDKVSIARGVDPLLDKEAIRVVKSMPAWTPGQQRGKAVNVWFTVPINFKLQ